MRPKHEAIAVAMNDTADDAGVFPAVRVVDGVRSVPRFKRLGAHRAAPALLGNQLIVLFDGDAVFFFEMESASLVGPPCMESLGAINARRAVNFYL